jgi:hypothetical protein
MIDQVLLELVSHHLLYSTLSKTTGIRTGYDPCHHRTKIGLEGRFQARTGRLLANCL